jgi:hypothetical protein
VGGHVQTTFSWNHESPFGLFLPPHGQLWFGEPARPIVPKEDSRVAAGDGRILGRLFPAIRVGSIRLLLGFS